MKKLNAKNKTASEAAKKRRNKFWLRISVIAIVSLIMTTLTVSQLLREKTSPANQPASTKQYLTARSLNNDQTDKMTWVPVSLSFRGQFATANDLPLIDEQKLNDAFALIERLKNSPYLASPDDQAIFQLLTEYKSGQRKMFKIQKIKLTIIDEKSGSKNMPTLAYSWSRDTLAVNPDQHPTTEILALKLYHELFHVVDCQQTMKACGITEQSEISNCHLAQECVLEFGAYAASTRFLAALNHEDLIPRKFYNDEQGCSDLGAINLSVEALQSLNQGTFCSWYGQQRAEGFKSPYGINVTPLK